MMHTATIDELRSLFNSRPEVVRVLPEDTVDAAEAQATAWHDPRVIHVWDGTGEVNTAFARSLTLTGPGWDLYLIYARGVCWEDDLPPLPTFWMHQLSPAYGADPGLHLHQDPSRLGHALDDLLANTLMRCDDRRHER